MLKEILATFLLSGSIGAKSLPVTVPVYDVFHETADIDYSISPQVVTGVYNFRDTIDVRGLRSAIDGYRYIEYFQIDRIESEGGGMPYERHNCPISINNVTYWLEGFTLELDGNDLTIYFDYYYPQHYNNELAIGFEPSDNDLADVGATAQELIFNIRDGLVLSSNGAKCFDALFTHYDNAYTTTYNGYIHFLSNITFNYPFTAFGTEIIDIAMYYDLLVPIQPSGSYLNNTLIVQKNNYYTYDYIFYEDVSYQLPLASYERDWLTGNYKMSLTSKRNLGYIAYFGYVRDTSYDDVTFKDFFFSIVDTPVYFASSLLSFELFGVNLFVALTGLLTLCCILLLIKKFW